MSFDKYFKHGSSESFDVRAASPQQAATKAVQPSSYDKYFEKTTAKPAPATSVAVKKPPQKEKQTFWEKAAEKTKEWFTSPEDNTGYQTVRNPYTGLSMRKGFSPEVQKKYDDIVSEIDYLESVKGYVSTVEQADEIQAQIDALSEEASGLRQSVGLEDKSFTSSERLEDWGNAWGNQFASAYVGAAGNVSELYANRYDVGTDEKTYNALTPEQQAEYDRLMAQREQLEQSRAYVTTTEQSDELEAAFKANTEALQAIAPTDQSKAEALYAKSDELNREYQKSWNKATYGQSDAEIFLMQAGHQGLSIAADSLATIATIPLGGWGGKVSMAGRVYGQTASEARRQGDDVYTAAKKGITSAAIETISEMIGGGFDKVYGESLISGAVGKFVSNPIVKGAIDALGEGAEEGLASVVQLAADHMFGWSKSGNTFLEDIKANSGDMVYEMLLGIFVGVFGASGQIAIDSAREAEAIAAFAKVYGGSAEDIIQQGLDRAEGSKAYRMALNNQEKLAQNGKLSDADLYKQFKANIEQMEAEGRIEETSVPDSTEPADAYLQKVELHDAAIAAAEAEMDRTAEPSNAEVTEPPTPDAEQDAVEVSNVPNAEQPETPKAETKVQPTKSKALHESYADIESNNSSIESYAAKYEGRAADVQNAYTEGQSVEEFGKAFDAAYRMGESMLPERSLGKVQNLTDEQKQIAFQMGRDAAKERATTRALNVFGKGTGGRGVVSGDGISLADVRKKFNDAQNTAYRVLDKFARATGMNIVLYSSDETGSREEGSFSWKDNTIRININSGVFSSGDVKDLSKYTALRTFSHELTHFTEKWNAEQYDSLREFVFEALDAKGVDVDERIQLRMAAGLSYDMASREVVADSMADMLGQSDIFERLAQKDAGMAQSLLNKLKEFVARLKQAFKSMTTQNNYEAEVLKDTIGYSEELVKKWTDALEGSIEAYKTKSEQPKKPKEKKPETSKERKSEEVPLPPAVIRFLTKAAKNDKAVWVMWNKQRYLTDGVMLLPVDKAAVDYAIRSETIHARNLEASKLLQDIVNKEYSLIASVPDEVEAVGYPGKLVKFGEAYFDMSRVKAIDGGFFYVSGDGARSILKATDKEGKPTAYLLPVIANSEPKVIGSAKLKSFNKSMMKELESMGESTASTETETLPESPKPQEIPVVETTEKITDFGEKIGGARKDEWGSRGLNTEDLDGMNARERDKHVKKDNVWKRPNYVKLVEGGEDRGRLYLLNEIRKSINQNISYRRSDDDTAKKSRQELFVETVREIQQMAEKAESAADLQKMGYDWGLKKGYIQETGNMYRPYSYTQKGYDNPAIGGSTYFSTIEYLVKNYSRLEELAKKEQFAVDAKSKVPAGYKIAQDDSKGWFIAKGYRVIKDGIPSYEDALNILQTAVAKKKGKTRFVPKQLLEVHRKGLNYRGGENVDGNDYIKTFSFKGGEFGNWMGTKDRQVSLNYGFDALKDLAAALGIEDRDISFGGLLNIAFGARGQGLSGAAAHYEPARQVINLTKMNGAGSLAHEWFHALDDFIGGHKNTMATDNARVLPELSREAMRKLISTMQYRDMTDAETDLGRQKIYEQSQRSVDYQVRSHFGWVKKMEAGTLTDADVSHFARKPTQEDLDNFNSLLEKLLSTGDYKFVDELSELRKSIVGRVIPKEDRDAISSRLYSLRPEYGKNVQRGRVRTDFYNNSRRFGQLHSKDGDYWDSTVEMSARAFACYVADKTGKNNDYLSGHSDSAITFDSDAKGELLTVRAFPVGEERIAINAAFDNLIAALKADGYLHSRTEESADLDIVQYSRRKTYDPSRDFYWAENDGIIDSEQQRVLQEAVEKISRGYEGFPKTYKGERVVDYGDALMFVSGTYEEPRLTRIISFSSENETYLVYAKEWIVRGEEESARAARQAHNAIEDSYGYGFASEQTGPAYSTNARVAGRREGKNSRNGDKPATLSERLKADGYVFDEELGRYVKSEDEQAARGKATLSDRELLEAAAARLPREGLTESEKLALVDFQKKLDKLKELQEQRAEQGRIYKEQMFTKGRNKEEAQKTKNRMDILDKKINSLENTILSMKDRDVFKKILKSARDMIEREARASEQKTLAEYRAKRNESEGQKKYRDRVIKTVRELMAWISTPSAKEGKRVPLELQEALSGLLSSIDFTSKRALKGGNPTKQDIDFKKKLQAVKDALDKNIEAVGAESGYVDIRPEFSDEYTNLLNKIDSLIGEGEDYVINRMSSEDLKQLSELLKEVKHYIQNANTMHENEVFKTAHEAGDETIKSLGELGKAPKHSELADRFFTWYYNRPAYVFSYFGKGGESVYQEFRKAQGIQARLTKEVLDFSEQTFTPEMAKRWAETTRTFNIDGENVKIPITHIMSMYCLSKREQGLLHLLGGGFRVANFKNGKQTVSDVGHKITKEKLDEILATLDQFPAAKKVADELQKYMSTVCAAWGNEVDMVRFGVPKFLEKNYFPVNSDGRQLAATADEAPKEVSLYALLNAGFTKSLQIGANNRLIVYDIFDVFASHTNSMVQYRSFALPVLDALKWFNHKNGQGVTVRDAMSKAFGSKSEEKGSGGKSYAEDFVINLLKDYNGARQGSGKFDTVLLKGLSNINRTRVSFNLSTMLLQPTSIARAGMFIGGNKLLRGFGMAAKDYDALAAEMEKHSGIALWKSLGFYDVNVSRGVAEQIKQDMDWKQKFNELGMKGAEAADRFTWTAIWAASKASVNRAKYKTDAEYFEAVNTVFEEVIYKTQVVDSVLTKAEAQREKGFGAKSVMSFMSESVASTAVLSDAAIQYDLDSRRIGKAEAWKKNRKHIGRAVKVWTVSKVISAAVSALVAAWRDDDEYEEFGEKYFSALKEKLIEQLNPLSDLPLIGDVISMLQGYDDSSELGQIVSYFTSAWGIIGDKLDKDNDGDYEKYTWWGAMYKVLQGASAILGVPFATASRELVDLWNNTAGRLKPEWKLHTYDPGVQNSIKYAYLDGYISEEEAQQLLIEEGAIEEEDSEKAKSTAYWLVQNWQGIGKYDEIIEAVSTMNSSIYRTEFDHLISRGVREQDIYSKVTDYIKEGYLAGNISYSNAKASLEAYGGKEADDAEDIVNALDFELETGYEWDADGGFSNGVMRALEDGAISRQEAIEWYAKASSSTHGSLETAEEYVRVGEWRQSVAGAEDFNVSALEKWDKYGFHTTDAGLAKEDFVWAWKLYDNASAVYSNSGDRLKEKGDVFFEDLYNRYMRGEISFWEMEALAHSFYSDSYYKRYKFW